MVIIAGVVLLRSRWQWPSSRAHIAGLWRGAVGVASIQGLVSVLASVDVVLVAVLPVTTDQAASYQASMLLARVPLFLAGAAAAVSFPMLASGPLGLHGIIRLSYRVYAAVALPYAIALATLPGSILHIAFPASYSQASTVLPWTAAAGFFIGAVELMTTYHQAAGGYQACVRLQLVGLALSLIAVPVGWHLDGIVGIAVGSLVGAAGSAVLILGYTLRRWPGTIPIRLRALLGLAGFLILLIVVRAIPVVWLTVALVVIVVATYRVFTGTTASEPDSATDAGPPSDHSARRRYRGRHSCAQAGGGGRASTTSQAARRSTTQYGRERS
jgi:O-antigen/teichoic acid export membrane protein